jgi:hypothetical protein
LSRLLVNFMLPNLTDLCINWFSPSRAFDTVNYYSHDILPFINFQTSHSSFFTLNIERLSLFSFLVELGFELRALRLLCRRSYHLSHTASPRSSLKLSSLLQLHSLLK